eukprot:SM000008S22357  [mRNA]  locus=s8:1200254:1203012:+ [translate_table: standard]
MAVRRRQPQAGEAPELRRGPRPAGSAVVDSGAAMHFRVTAAMTAKTSQSLLVALRQSKEETSGKLIQMQRMEMTSVLPFEAQSQLLIKEICTFERLDLLDQALRFLSAAYAMVLVATVPSSAC